MLTPACKNKILIIRVCCTDNVLSPIHSVKPWPFYISDQWGKVRGKKCYFMCTYTISNIFLLFSMKKNCVFFIFMIFCDEVPNFCNRILTCQKPELVIRNCQWNYVITARNYAFLDLKVFFPSCPILLDFFTLTHQFFPRLYIHNNRNISKTYSITKTFTL